MVDEPNTAPDTPDVDDDFVAASNLDVAKRLPNDQIEPEPEPTPRPVNPYNATQYATVYGADPLGNDNVHKSNNPNTTSNLGDASEPLNERIETPLDAELTAMAMQTGQQTPAEQTDTANAAGSNNTSDTGSTDSTTSGFGRLSQVEKQS